MLYSIFKVSGDSMSPTLMNGDYVIVKNRPRSFRPGFIYVVKHERLGRIVKRLENKVNGALSFTGDNPNSTSSERIGSVQPHFVLGKAIFAITPKGLKRL
jgi:nickel-type superoxide dismutase maturation protease